MTGSVKIRHAEWADASDIKSIETECGLSPWTLSFYERVVSDADYVLIAAAMEQEIIGFLCARLITITKNVFPKNRMAVEAEILNIAVLKEFRKQGIGSSLLNDLLERLMEYQGFSVFLEVRESNNSAREFYRSSGFVETGKRVDYYRQPVEDAVLMSLMRADETDFRV